MSWRFAQWIGLRAGRAALTVLGVVSIVFVLVRLIPGDPVAGILGDESSPADRARMRRVLLLDRPVAEQYLGFLGNVADGTLGESFRRSGETVASLIADVLPDTILLAFSAVAVAWLIAVPLGALAAARRRSVWDKVASTIALVGLAVPVIWMGPLLILLFGVQLRWLPLPGDELAGWQPLVLPAATVGAALAAILTRQTRASMIEVLSEQYILAARARGVSPVKVVLVHALRNALLPVITVGAVQLGAVLSGTVIAEKIFERPGLGTLMLDAFFARDYPVVQGCVVVVAAIYVGVNLLLDVTYGLIDPRVRSSP